MMCSVIETTKESDIRILLSETFSSLFAFFVLPFSCNNAFLHWDLPFTSKTVICQFFVITVFFFPLCFLVIFAPVPLLSHIGILSSLQKPYLSLLAPTLDLTCTLQLVVSDTRQGNLIAASSPSPTSGYLTNKTFIIHQSTSELGREYDLQMMQL